GPPAAFLDGAGGVVPVGRVADGEAPGDGARLDGTDLAGAVLDGGHDRVAAGRLGAVQLRLRTLDPAEERQLVERLADLGEQRPARHAAHQVGRPPPAGLFGDFKAHGLGSLAVERAQIDVDDPPAEAVGDLAAQAV